MPSTLKWDFQFLKAGRELVLSQSVWSFLFWNESVLAQNYTKKFCQGTLSFVSMTLQIFPNKFDVSQQDPAFILPNKSAFLNTINPRLTQSTGRCQNGERSWPHAASSRKGQAFCHGPDKVVFSCFRGSLYNTATTSCFDVSLINFLNYPNSSDEGHCVCAVCLYCCLIMNRN